VEEHDEDLCFDYEDWEEFCSSPEHNFTKPDFTTRIPKIRYPKLIGKTGRLEVKLRDGGCNIYGFASHDV
jgi:hypothetical protein